MPCCSRPHGPDDQTSGVLLRAAGQGGGGHVATALPRAPSDDEWEPGSPSGSETGGGLSSIAKAWDRCASDKDGGKESWMASITTNLTMLASVAVFLYEGVAYNVIYLGRILPALGRSAFVLPYGLLFNLMWGMAVWSYVQAHITDAGVLPASWHSFVRSAGAGLTVVHARLEWQPGKATLCRKCGIPRPERAHHCHICNTCVLRMDHHCPWIRNCVGFKNHKFFLLLVVYTTLAAFVGFVTALPDLYTCTRALLTSEAVVSDLKARLSDFVAFVVFGILALFFLALLLPMIATHFPLAAQNVTSIESHYDSAAELNPFDQEGTVANLSQIFGKPGLDWFFPVQPRRPLTDGVSFRRFSDGRRRRFSTDGPAEEDCEAEAGEELWRLRYRVRDTTSRSSSRDPEPSAIEQLTTWWKASGEAGSLLACSRSKSGGRAPR